MKILPPPLARLRMLNEAQPDQPWRSCNDKRECIACGRVFCGRAVRIRAQRKGLTHLECPGCGSGPELWVRPGNPLLDEKIWADWENALATLSVRDDPAFG